MIRNMRSISRRAQVVTIGFLFAFCQYSAAVRLIDLVDIEGVRSNQLVGYGLVVGLQGTGDRQPRFTGQSMTNMLRQFGVQLSPGQPPRVKNVAAVSISALQDTFARPGQRLDVQVSSIGDAKSLRGGMLLASPLRGMDDRVYAVAQGSVVIGGISAEGASGSRVSINTTTVGRIPGGAVIERSVLPDLASGGDVRLNLKSNSLSQSRSIVRSINTLFGSDTAVGIDGSQVLVKTPETPDKRVTFLSMLEGLEVDVGVKRARILIDARTGTVVIGANVRVRAVAVSSGTTTVKVYEQPMVSQPDPFSLGETLTVDRSTVEIKQKEGGVFLMPEAPTLEALVTKHTQHLSLIHI